MNTRVSAPSPLPQQTESELRLVGEYRCISSVVCEDTRGGIEEETGNSEEKNELESKIAREKEKFRLTTSRALPPFVPTQW